MGFSPLQQLIGPLFAHDFNQRQALQRAIVAKANGIDPKGYSEMYPGSTYNVTNIGSPGPSTSPAVSPAPAAPAPAIPATSPAAPASAGPSTSLLTQIAALIAAAGIGAGSAALAGKATTPAPAAPATPAAPTPASQLPPAYEWELKWSVDQDGASVTPAGPPATTPKK